MSTQTPSQTVGPFFAIGMPYPNDGRIVPPWRADAITVHGVVYDGAGEPVPDAVVEIWQAGVDGGLRADPGALARDEIGFTGFGRSATDGAGHYLFHTARPGAVVDRDGNRQRPHLAVVVFARGVTLHLYTRIYFPESEQARLADPLLASLPPARAATLLAQPESADRYRFDVRLQGEAETVFLELQ